MRHPPRIYETGHGEKTRGLWPLLCNGSLLPLEWIELAVQRMAATLYLLLTRYLQPSLSELKPCSPELLTP